MNYQERGVVECEADGPCPLALNFELSQQRAGHQIQMLSKDLHHIKEQFEKLSDVLPTLQNFANSIDEHDTIIRGMADRIGSQRGEMDGKLGALGDQISLLFDRMDQRLEKGFERLRLQEQEIAVLITDVTHLKAEMSHLGNDVRDTHRAIDRDIEELTKELDELKDTSAFRGGAFWLMGGVLSLVIGFAAFTLNEGYQAIQAITRLEEQMTGNAENLTKIEREVDELQVRTLKGTKP